MVFKDEEMIMFITDKDLYCYKVMLFGFKNTAVTYQRRVNKVFKDKIGCNMEVHIDNMLVKSTEATLHIDDLAEAFNILKKHQMKLNLTKCAFDIMLEKFLNFIVMK